VRALEVPVDDFPLQCPWCVPLTVPVVRFFLVLHMHKRYALQYFRYKKKGGHQRTNEPRTKYRTYFFATKVAFHVHA